jgi:hypothetical protein
MQRLMMTPVVSLISGGDRKSECIRRCRTTAATGLLICALKQWMYRFHFKSVSAMPLVASAFTLCVSDLPKPNYDFAI